MPNDNQCIFDEPWRGQCTEPKIADSICCAKHSKEKCQVCGEQATTRCQASIGLMCGIPLCHRCGQGEMCLYHAASGPLAIIRGLLDGGPVMSMFSTVETLEEDRVGMLGKIERLKKFRFSGVLSKTIAVQIEEQLKAKKA